MGRIASLAGYTDVTVADITRQRTITEMAEAVLEIGPERFALAGFSLGSQVALEVMRLSKDRVDRLALLSATHGGLLPPVGMAIRHAVSLIEQDGFDQYLETAYST